MSFNAQESRILREMVARNGAVKFARDLVDELRDIADCDANSDTCSNETCFIANAIEQGISCEGCNGQGWDVVRCWRRVRD